MFFITIYLTKNSLSPTTPSTHLLIQESTKSFNFNLLANLSHFTSIKNYPSHSIIGSFSPSNRKEKSQLTHINIYIILSLSSMHLSFPLLSQFKFPFTYIICFHIAIEMIAHQACTLALIHNTKVFFLPTKSTQIVHPTKLKET